MPLYEYQCQACGQRFEQIRKFSDPPLEQCAKCGKGPVERLMSSPAFQFKGSGWYVTDYAKKDTSTAGGSSGTAKTDAPKEDKAKSESTPASTPAAAPAKE